MKDSENPETRKKGAEAGREKSRKQRRKNIIMISVSVVLLAAILLIAFFVTPMVSRQTSGEILPGDIDSIIIESGDAKIEMGARSDMNVIQYFLTGSAEMKWKVEGSALLIKADEGSLRVSLPKSLALRDLRILSTSKDIEITEIDAERIELVNAEDEIRIYASESDEITASGKGDIRFELSSSGDAEFRSGHDIEIKDSTLASAALFWSDGKAEIENTYVSELRAASRAGKLEIGTTNGVSSIVLNGEDVSVYPSDYQGARIVYDTESGEMKSLPGTVRIGD